MTMEDSIGVAFEIEVSLSPKDSPFEAALMLGFVSMEADTELYFFDFLSVGPGETLISGDMDLGGFTFALSLGARF